MCNLFSAERPQTSIPSQSQTQETKETSQARQHSGPIFTNKVPGLTSLSGNLIFLRREKSNQIRHIAGTTNSAINVTPWNTCRFCAATRQNSKRRSKQLINWSGPGAKSETATSRRVYVRTNETRAENDRE